MTSVVSRVRAVGRSRRSPTAGGESCLGPVSASHTRAGPRTACRASATLIRTSAAAVSRWCTTASSRTTRIRRRTRRTRLSFRIRDRHRGRRASGRAPPGRGARPARRGAARGVAPDRRLCSLGVISRHEPGRLIAARQGSPLVIGIGIGRALHRVRRLALLPVARSSCSWRKATSPTCHAVRSRRERRATAGWSNAPARLGAECWRRRQGPYRHHAGEIHEQPAGRRHARRPAARRPRAARAASATRPGALSIRCARSTSSPAAPAITPVWARYWLEPGACRPRSRSRANTATATGGARHAVRQHLAVRRDCRHVGGAARCEAHAGVWRASRSATCRKLAGAPNRRCVLMTRAGREIGVASTKAFTTQLVALRLFGDRARSPQTALDAAAAETQTVAEPHAAAGTPGAGAGARSGRRASGRDLRERRTRCSSARRAVPDRPRRALKLKEISYIHVEAYAAGELWARSAGAGRSGDAGDLRAAGQRAASRR